MRKRARWVRGSCNRPSTEAAELFQVTPIPPATVLALLGGLDS